MHDSPNAPVVSDPDNVPETLCLGRFNLGVNGSFAMITFTHSRPKTETLFESGAPETESIVRARIVTSVENLIALKALIESMQQRLAQGKPSKLALSSKHN